MRHRILILRDEHSPENAACVATSCRALDLWRVPHEVVEVAGLSRVDLADVAVIVAEDVHQVPDGAGENLEAYVRSGGSLILGGLLGTDAAGPVPEPFASLSGVTRLDPRPIGPTFRVPRLVEAIEAAGPWAPGTVLFFHNPAYASAARGRDFDLELAPDTEVLARSCLADLLDEEREEWGKYSDDDAPSWVARTPFPGGGRVVYAPLPLGLVDRARCMTTAHGVTRPEMPQENHATLLWIKTAIEALARKAGGLVPSVALWPGASRGVFGLSGDVHEYPDDVDGNRRCEYFYIREMKELMEARGLVGRFTYCICGRTFDYHPAVVREIAEEDIIGHPYGDISYAGGVPYEEQIEDIAAALAAIQRTLPQCRTFRLGWRDHGVTGNHDSRRAMQDLDFLYASDYAVSDPAEWNWKRFDRPMIVHVNYPMKTARSEGGVYRFWELGYIQTDIDLMQQAERQYYDDEREWFHAPGEARRAWQVYVDRALREEGMLITIWHPWASLRTAAERAEVEATIEYMQQQEGAAFLSLSDIARWWEARDCASIRFEKVAEGWEVRVENPLDRDLEDLGLVVAGGSGRVRAATGEGRECRVETRAADAIVCLTVEARSRKDIRIFLD